MKIKEVRSIPLFGWTDDTGWDFKLDPAENQHTLIEVKTDEGLTGIGSVYTSKALVDASLRLLMPFVIDENALEPERVSEKLHQMTFWNGCRAACRPPAGRVLPPAHQALWLDLIR